MGSSKRGDSLMYPYIKVSEIQSVTGTTLIAVDYINPATPRLNVRIGEFTDYASACSVAGAEAGKRQADMYVEKV